MAVALFGLIDPVTHVYRSGQVPLIGDYRVVAKSESEIVLSDPAVMGAHGSESALSSPTPVVGERDAGDESSLDGLVLQRGDTSESGFDLVVVPSSPDRQAPADKKAEVPQELRRNLPAGVLEGNGVARERTKSAMAKSAMGKSAMAPADDDGRLATSGQIASGQIDGAYDQATDAKIAPGTSAELELPTSRGAGRREAEAEPAFALNARVQPQSEEAAVEPEVGQKREPAKQVQLENETKGFSKERLDRLLLSVPQDLDAVSKDALEAGKLDDDVQRLAEAPAPSSIPVESLPALNIAATSIGGGVLRPSPDPLALAQRFLAARARLDGLEFQDATGYWSNTYVPGDAEMRRLAASLRDWDRSTLHAALGSARFEQVARAT